MRHNNIVSAIEWLPEHLFTEEIVEAAVESKEIEVLSHIPGRFLTPGRIERIIAGSTESCKHSINSPFHSKNVILLL